MPPPITLTANQIMRALNATGGLRAAAAGRLGISPATLRRKMRELGLEPYYWEISQRKRARNQAEARLVARAEAGHYASQRYLLTQARWCGELNEPTRLSDAETKELIIAWDGMLGYHVVQL